MHLLSMRGKTDEVLGIGFKSGMRGVRVFDSHPSVCVPSPGFPGSAHSSFLVFIWKNRTRSKRGFQQWVPHVINPGPDCVCKQPNLRSMYVCSEGFDILI